MDQGGEEINSGEHIGDLEKCYDQIKEILRDKTEPFDSVRLVYEYRQYFKPDPVNIILLAESHVRTTDEDRGIPLLPLSCLPGYPEHYAKFVYCLAYGERNLTKSQSHPKRDGTPQFWEVFYSCDNIISSNTDFGSILKRTPFEDRKKEKIRLLVSLKHKGIWLLDTSIVGLYPKNMQTSAQMNKALETSWKGYTGKVVVQAKPKFVVCVGKSIYDTFEAELRSIVGEKNLDWVFQPNYYFPNAEARLENLMKISRICCSVLKQV